MATPGIATLATPLRAPVLPVLRPFEERQLGGATSRPATLPQLQAGAATSSRGAAASSGLALGVLWRWSARRRATTHGHLRRRAEGAQAVKIKETKGVEATEKDSEAPKEDDLEPFFEEVSGDDPMVMELEERLKKMNNDKSLTLDMVLNPGTIVNTEREVILLKAQLKATPDEEMEKIKELEDKIEEKQMKIVNEMKLVMTNNLKLEFLVQAILSIFAFGAMCYDAFPWVPDLTWAGINARGSMLALKLFGIWGLWLFTVPALRARKPGSPYGMGYEEKRALDLSFLVLPFICIFGPVLFQEASATFWLSLATLGGLYVWSFNTPLSDGKIQRGAGQDLNLPEPVMWAIKALDFGTGSERGARSEDLTWQAQLAAYEKAGEELAKLKAEKQKTAESVDKSAKSE